MNILSGKRAFSLEKKSCVEMSSRIPSASFQEHLTHFLLDTLLRWVHWIIHAIRAFLIRLTIEGRTAPGLSATSPVMWSTTLACPYVYTECVLDIIIQLYLLVSKSSRPWNRLSKQVISPSISNGPILIQRPPKSDYMGSGSQSDWWWKKWFRGNRGHGNRLHTK